MTIRRLAHYEGLFSVGVLLSLMVVVFIIALPRISDIRGHRYTHLRELNTLNDNVNRFELLNIDAGLRLGVLTGTSAPQYTRTLEVFGNVNICSDKANRRFDMRYHRILLLGVPASCWWIRGDRTPELRIANGLGPPLQSLSCNDMRRHNLTILQQVAAITGTNLLVVFDIEFHRFAESRVTNR